MTFSFYYLIISIFKGSSSVKNHLWLILDTEHWLEICDEKHRYGSNLKVRLFYNNILSLLMKFYLKILQKRKIILIKILILSIFRFIMTIGSIHHHQKIFSNG